MKRLQTPSMRRAKATTTGVARDRKDAAIQLVRLEFDINRLESAIGQAEARATQHRAELKLQTAERAKLMALLGSS